MMSLLDICICIIILLLGFNLKNFFGKFSKSEKKILNLLFVYHILFSLIFTFYISRNGGDALHYWETPKVYSIDQIIVLAKTQSASGFLYFFNYVPSVVLNLSFLTGNLLYACFGYLGFLFIFKVIKHIFISEKLNKVRLFKIPLFPLIWFFPNFHFWSSGIGKDTLIFTSIAIFIYSLIYFRKYWTFLLLSILIMFLIRPHILLFLLIAFGISFTMDAKLKGYQKGLLFLVFLVGFLSIFNFVLDFIQLESFEASAISEYASNKSSSLSKGEIGSRIDTSAYSFPLKLFTFLYRPFFFDINGILFFLASFENFILLIFSIKIMLSKPVSGFKTAKYTIKAGLIFFVIGTIAFSLILGNLGIMLREKNMLMPWFVLFGLWVLYQYKLKETKAI